ncbi:MAG: serine hydrolase [Bacteroidia bacterium]|jgi:CubicO group peptidase (beta-lactamase class C family)|nr:serine hydrolase [Bacteroidia bacterium]
MKRTILIAWLCMVSGSALAQTKYTKDIEDQIKLVENGLSGRVKINGKTYNLQERMAHFKVKGLSIAVIKNYKIVWAKGYGWADEKEKRPVNTQTLFEPGSISKSLNAVAVLKLVHDKKLDLYADINTYLTSWKFPYDSVSKNKKITLANLLSHSAGLGVHGFPGYDRKEKIPTLVEILDGKKPANTPAVRSEFEPGLKFKYSGGGTSISQLIITDVTNQPYDQFLYETVLKPIGMVNSTYSQPLPKDKLKFAATGYDKDGREVPNKFHVYPEQGAAGLWMTPSDLCNYIIETQWAYQGKSSKVLNQEMTKLRLTPYLDESSALGVFIEDRGGVKYFQHGAGNEGFRGQYYGSLEGGNGVAVFVNSDNGAILFEVINSVAEVYKWKNFYFPEAKNVVTVPDAVLQTYEGIYLFEDKYAIVLPKEDGYYYLTDGVYSKMHFTSETDFFNEEFLAEKTFMKDSSGKVIGFSRQVRGKTFPQAIKVENADTLSLPAYQLNTMGWYLLENKQYDKAISFLNRGIKLMPEDPIATGNLGHCYLFKGDFKRAIRLYQDFLFRAVGPYENMKDMISQDFVFFKNNGFDAGLMNKAFAELKLEIPEAYKQK